MKRTARDFVAAKYSIAIAFALLFCGCATRKECSIVLINQRHPGELAVILKEHEALTMDLLKVIAELEQETGHYR